MKNSLGSFAAMRFILSFEPKHFPAAKLWIAFQRHGGRG